MSVSYYFDKAEYATRGELGFDPELFVAGGVACWDLDEQRWTWLVHLDLTTAKSKYDATVVMLFVAFHSWNWLCCYVLRTGALLLTLMFSASSQVSSNDLRITHGSRPRWRWKVA